MVALVRQRQTERMTKKIHRKENQIRCYRRPVKLDGNSVSLLPSRVLPSFNGFPLGFSGFFFWVFWVLLDFSWFYWVLLGFTGLYWVFLDFTRLYRVFTGFYWVLLGFTGFYWVLLGCIGFEPGCKAIFKGFTG